MSHAKSSSSSPNDFILPDLGEGVAEAELIKWRVSVGDAVKEHDILADMETDKALVEVPSPRTGVIAALHGNAGEIIKVGSALVTFAQSGAAAGAPAANHAAASKPVVDTRAGKPAISNGAHVLRPEGTPAPAAKPAANPSTLAPEAREDAGTVVGSVSGAALAGITAQPGKALATPAVRRLARDLGVDIDTVTGSGMGGRVTEQDVRSSVGSHASPAPVAATTPASAARPVPALAPRVVDPAPARPAPSISVRQAPALAQGEATLRVPFRGVRRTIANRLRESVNQAVHFNVMDEADVSVLDGLRKKLASASGEKLSFLPFVAAAVCRVLTREQFRALNATVDEKPSDASYEASIVQHRAVHLGIATDTDNGLMVPVIRDCDALGVLEIGRHITHVAESARSRSAPREMLMGSTFTISNVGSHAGRFATPIINYPEVAILAVGRGRPGPVVRSIGGVQGIFVGNLLPLSLACDHRVVDGATAALALAEIIRLLQEPESLMGPARG